MIIVPHHVFETIIKDFKLSNDDYRRVVEVLEVEMNKGLMRSSNADAAIKMFPTYVRSVPDGSEEGNFLALDLGGTNFRVLLIMLKGEKVEMKSRIYPISQEIMKGAGEKLFDHIAHCIARFLEEHDLKEMKLPLGFTFSFPCKQQGLSRAILVKWTKGFTCDGVEGEDIVRMLHEAIQRRGDIDVQCLAVINDTVGTLMACAHSDRNCQIGLILGTGTNACYMETLDRVETWDGDAEDPKQWQRLAHECEKYLADHHITDGSATVAANDVIGKPYVIVNTEWGAFGDNGCLDFVRTEYDQEVDRNSLYPGKQRFEKMISGMYMGEIVRLVLVRMIKEGLLFEGLMSEEMETRERFYTKYISEIESDTNDEFVNTNHVLEEMGYDDVTTEECRTVQKICSLVSSRAAYLSSAGIACILNRIAKPNITCAVDGSLYRFHPKFHDLMNEKIAELVNPGIKYKLMLSSDGSGKGAALVAAVAYRMKLQNVPVHTKSNSILQN